MSLQVISKHRVRNAAYVGSTDPISPALNWSGFIKTTESEGTDGPTKQATAEDRSRKHLSFLIRGKGKEEG